MPQFHPIPENDAWWGKGFTEWTNVAKAKKYFRGHYQPKIPADLGFYDLRLPEVRDKQAELAKEAGVSAFCYWHYWFGNGKQLLERPLQEVIRLGKPDFPFMLGWANHSWISKNWNAQDSSIIRPSVLIEQEYPGEQDIIAHFHRMLPVFRDKRYIRIHGKIPFLIYQIENIPDLQLFKETWNSLACLNGLPKFFFIAYSEIGGKLMWSAYEKADALCLCRLNPNNLDRKLPMHIRLAHAIRSYVFRMPANVFDYAEVIKRQDTPLYERQNIYPAIIPNWDPSPRRGINSCIYHNSTPELFGRHVKTTLKRIAGKGEDDQIVFLKSWNEWAEGNYMEPDLKYGKGYIQALRNALDEMKGGTKNK